MNSIIAVIANMLFPLATLPDAALALRTSEGRRPAEGALDLENSALIIIHRLGKSLPSRGQRPRAVHVVRQHHRGIDVKGWRVRVARTAARSSSTSVTSHSARRSRRATVKK
jgi:hypothetical protein